MLSYPYHPTHVILTPCILTRTTKQKIALLKVDLVKAHDRVEHIFLWETLTAMGFDKKFIALVRGLIEEGFSKVHFNGLFTMGIPLFKGVRQGCSIAPILFVLSTQPYMSLLAKSAAQGELVGLQIHPDKQLVLMTRASSLKPLRRTSVRQCLSSQYTRGFMAHN